MYIYIHTYLYIYMCVCMCVCMYVCMYACMYVFVCVQAPVQASRNFAPACYNHPWLAQLTSQHRLGFSITFDDFELLSVRVV